MARSSGGADTTLWSTGLDDSAKWFKRAQEVFPDGVNSAIRGDFQPHPIFAYSASGSKLRDVDGNEYLDMIMGYGPVILGHADQGVNEALVSQIGKGLLFGISSPLEVEVGELVKKLVPCAEMLRFTSSGTEATMHAIRIARSYTGKSKFLKFEGHYHGNHDQVLVSISPPAEVIGSESDPVKIPVGSGIPQENLANTVLSVWNDIDAAERVIRRHRHELAAVITEPVMANKGFIPPKDGYLRDLLTLCRENDVLLIFDEVITGFRLSPGGAQEAFGVTPDLAAFAKAMSNGMTIGAVAGRREVMSVLEGRKTRHAGTYNAAPLAMVAAKATMSRLVSDGGAVYERMRSLTQRLVSGLGEAGSRAGLPVLVQGQGSMFQLYFTELPRIDSFRAALTVDRNQYVRFAKGMIERGVLMHPDRYERSFISAAHTEADVDLVLEVASDVFRELAARPAA